jgi:hypothetical protein
MARLFSFMLLIVLAGCGQTVISPNMELSALRSAGDISVTAVLDSSSEAALGKRIDEVSRYADAVLDFLAGDPSDLVQAALLDHLEKIRTTLSIPDYLSPVLHDAVKSLKNVDTSSGVSKIGSSNVLRISEFFVGARYGASSYRPTIRTGFQPSPGPNLEPDAAPEE